MFNNIIDMFIILYYRYNYIRVDFVVNEIYMYMYSLGLYFYN